MLPVVSILHIVGALFAFIELVMSAWLVDWYAISPSSVNFVVFCSVWSLLVLAYVGLAPVYAASIYRSVAALGALVVTAIFWFAGAIAEAVAVGTQHCGGWSACHTAQASIAFSFFLW
jgi:accessory gene regulator protein AgrB